MKLVLFIGVAVSLVVTAVLAGPVDDFSDEIVSQDVTSDELWEMDEGNYGYQESFPQGPQGDFEPTSEEPLKDVNLQALGEVLEPSLPVNAAKQLKLMLSNQPQQEETGSIQGSCRTRKIPHGSTVALQYEANMARWLGCAGNPCVGAPCPGMFFTGAEWNNCYGEVFQIYRALGRGDIQSGDFVGLYYVRSRRWFSLAGNKAHTNTCPGKAMLANGFEHLYKWFLCGGEVFQIFAYGKKIGAPLDNQDAVILYYPAGGTYVHFPTNGHPQFGNKCLQGRPPSSDKFDKCPENLIKITVK